MNFRRVLAKHYVNFRGWSTRRKLVVIESDDWGSIRMPSKAVYEILLAKGVPVTKSYFVRNDSLESKEDLDLLFNALISFKDMNGNHPSITANSLVANPDFEKIEASGFEQYYYEPISQTYKRYFGDEGVLALWKSSMDKRLLYPQFHGREHIGVHEWMNAIRSGEEQERIGFEYRVILGLGNRKSTKRKKDYTAAFDYLTEEEKGSLIPIVSDGLRMFESTFGFRSKSFIAPGAIRGDYLDDALAAGGIRFHQGGQQWEPTGTGDFKVINRYWGARNSLGQVYWRRNATFEPSRQPDFDWVNSCLKEISIAFTWGKPAVINSHRVNFVGSINPANRDNSLKLLNMLLKNITNRWPDVEFISSDQLGDIMLQEL
jgi:hypothetical protein